METSANNETLEGIKAFYPRTINEWRDWLAANYNVETAVWLVLYHKNSKMPGITYDQSIEHALCYGWIDSKAKKRDEQSSYLKFTPRKPSSNWSKSNIARVKRMIDGGYMTPAGQLMIDKAKNSGKWIEIE
ncbi:MAG TPA: hypothetical protein VHO90_16500 [Bacteroidales bacterium]|nr:hypothetical protein [Bacteroidales bacterium]